MANIIRITSRVFICWMIACFISACDDFLASDDPSNFNIDNYYVTSDQAESAVVAIYPNTEGAWMMTEYLTGTANTEATGDPSLTRNLQYSADLSGAKTYWASHYKGIANANMAILKIPNIEMDEDRKKELLGEAKFLRAYYYFNLVRIFGKVPLITGVIDLTSDDLYPKQASVEDIYSLIVNDLIAAEESGLPYKDEGGRVSLSAVKSLLSSVYLTMAGFPLRKGNEYYELAKDKAENVISSEQFYLFNTYDDLHNKSTDNKGEHIFMIQFDELERPSNDRQSSLVPYKGNITLFSSEIGEIYAQTEFVESYESGDKRVEENEFFFTKFTLKGDRSIWKNLGGYWIFKLLDSIACTVTGRSGLNWGLIRYPDVLFNYAEASNELLGPTEEAYEMVNKIRRRAKLPDLSNLNQSQFREAIWRERFYELCFENKIWFDMVRIRKAFNFATKNFEEYVGHSFPYGVTLTERELLFPIPSTEMLDNKNLIQNFGY